MKQEFCRGASIWLVTWSTKMLGAVIRQGTSQAAIFVLKLSFFSRMFQSRTWPTISYGLWQQYMTSPRSFTAICAQEAAHLSKVLPSSPH